MVLALNTGSYVGSGSTRSTYSNYGSGSAANNSNHIASSSKLNRIAKDISTGYTSDIEAIEQYLASGKADKAIDLYNQLLEEVSETADDYGYTLSEGQKASILTKAYKYTTGESFNTAMAENTNSSFATGLKEGVPLVGWFAEGTSSEEALAKASGTKAEAKDKVAEGAGAAISNGLCLGALGAAAGALAIKGASIGTLAGGPAGAAIGAIGGALVGVGIGIFKTIVK